MAVTLTPSSSTADVRTYLHSEDTIVAVRKDQELGEDCGLCFLNCDIPEKQFIDTGDTTDEYKNDYKLFIMEGFSGGSIEASFENLSTGQAQTITDNSYGTLNDMGSNPSRPLVWLFITDWL